MNTIHPGYDLRYIDDKNNIEFTSTFSTLALAVRALRERIEVDHPEIVVPRTLLEDRDYAAIARFIKDEARKYDVHVYVTNLDLYAP